jgi:UDP-N-acetylmuramate dehydrogenase
MSWPLEPQEGILEKVKQANKTRLLKQPLELPSCGSVFRNPEGHKAGALIEQSGLKGFKIGGAQVSPKHANFIVNTGDAKARDIHRVIEHVKVTVFEKTKVKLHPEVVYLGRWEDSKNA